MYKASELELNKMLQMTLERGASDLHLVAGEPPIIRVDSMLIRLEEFPMYSNDSILDLVDILLNDNQKMVLKNQLDVDLSYAYKDKVRFRVNIYLEKGSLAIAMRLIPNRIKTIEELGLPPVLHKFLNRKQGLVLTVGPTGHGKSTALAAMIDEINHNRVEHILSIEDPIEFMFTPDKAFITQREVNVDTPSFGHALKSALREDINIILVGEMRDYDSIATVLTLAETGHLIFATLHTNDAAQSIDRMLGVFPGNQQGQARMQLAEVLTGVVSLRLLPKIGGGRTVGAEVLMANHAVRNVIRDNKTYQINNIIHTASDEGMIPMDKSLAQLVKSGQVDINIAREYVVDEDYFMSLIS